MGLDELEQRRKMLEARLNKVKEYPVLAIRFDTLKRLIKDCESNPILSEFFPGRTLEHIALVWDKANDDVLITDANFETLPGEADVKFLKSLRDIIEKDLR